MRKNYLIFYFFIFLLSNIFLLYLLGFECKTTKLSIHFINHKATSFFYPLNIENWFYRPHATLFFKFYNFFFNKRSSLTQKKKKKTSIHFINSQKILIPRLVVKRLTFIYKSIKNCYLFDPLLSNHQFLNFDLSIIKQEENIELQGEISYCSRVIWKFLKGLELLMMLHFCKFNIKYEYIIFISSNFFHSSFSFFFRNLIAFVKFDWWTFVILTKCFSFFFYVLNFSSWPE